MVIKVIELLTLPVLAWSTYTSSMPTVYCLLAMAMVGPPRSAAPSVF